MTESAAHVAALSGSGRRGLSLGPRTVASASVAAALAVFLAGYLSQICAGDENTHVRRAHAYTQSWSRTGQDPTVPHGLDTRYYLGTPLWHMGLGALWRLAGRDSAVVAQAYQAGFYLLLILSVYFGVRRVWDESAGSWAWLLAATMPMVLVYSVLLYQDVPGLALSALALLLLWRRQFLWSGLCLAAAYFTKMNMLVFAPWAAVLAVWWADGTWKRRLAALASLAAPVLLVFAWDAAWRQMVFGQVLSCPQFFPLSAADKTQAALTTRPEDFRIWSPFPFYSPRTFITHLGLGALVGLALAPWRARDKWSRWLWVCLALCAAAFYLVFVRRDALQIRYLFPAILAVTILAGVTVSTIRLPRWALALVVVGCAVQAVAALAFVRCERCIPPDEMAACDWIREHTRPTDRLMYPEELITSQTGRFTVWGEANPAYIMTDASDDQRRAVLDHLDVSYIVILKRRIYDRRVTGANISGYPADFVEVARSLPYLEKVFENPAVVIFRYRSLPPDAAGRPPGGDSPDS